MGDLLTRDEMRKQFSVRAGELGSQKALAKELGVSEAFVSDAINGHRGLPKKFLEKIGYRAETVYRKVKA